MPIKSADTTIIGKDRTPTLNSWRTNNGKPRQLGMTNRPLTRKMPARPSVLNVWRPLLPSLCKESSIPISLYQILGVIRRRIMEWNRAIRQAIQKLFHKGRSEERRVGKECRARTAQDHYKKRGK